MIVIFQSLDHLDAAIPLPPQSQTFPSGIEVVTESRRVLPSGTQLGAGVTGADGRIAIAHNFSVEDLIALQTIEGVAIMENLPEDWVYMQG